MSVKQRVEALERKRPSEDLADVALRHAMYGGGREVSDDELLQSGSKLGRRVVEARRRIGASVPPSTLYVP